MYVVHPHFRLRSGVGNDAANQDVDRSCTTVDQNENCRTQDPVCAKHMVEVACVVDKTFEAPKGAFVRLTNHEQPQVSQDVSCHAQD